VETESHNLTQIQRLESKLLAVYPQSDNTVFDPKLHTPSFMLGGVAHLSNCMSSWSMATTESYGRLGASLVTPLGFRALAETLASYWSRIRSESLPSSLLVVKSPLKLS
jgi:hypothetical protein